MPSYGARRTSDMAESVNKLEILRIASYHQRDFDLAVIRTDLHGHEKVRSSLLRTIPATSPTVGNLQSLPLEIVYEMCSLLDVRSLINLRHTNRRAQQIVRETSVYEAVIAHALAALCVTLRTNIASWFTFSDLTQRPCTRDCHICGSFSGFIFLPSFMRCCISYIREDSLPSVLPLSELKNRVESSSGCLYSLVPTVKSLPGTYSMYETV